MFSKYKSKLFLIFLLSGHLTAENLLDIYNEALENDPTFKAAEYSYLADKEIVVQGRAALLPSITLSGSTNWNEYYQDDVLQQEYNSFSKSARVSQPYLDLTHGSTLKDQNHLQMLLRLNLLMNNKTLF